MIFFRFAIPVRIYGKRRVLAPTTFSSLILSFLCLLTVHAISAATHKTDAELADAMVGTWQGLPTKPGVSKAFILLNADGTFRTILLTNNHGSAIRVENEGKWRISDGWVLWEITKWIPPDEKTRSSSHSRDYIESTDRGRVKLADGKTNSELRRVSRLPSLPPLITSAKWVRQLSVAEAKEFGISTPQPDYPINARARRIKGSGVFLLILTETGEVASIQVLKSTGSQILDDAAEKALKKWRFKPGIGISKINVPINFTL
jgi:TonB family protein